jgi:hypothetical protein
VCVCVCVCVCVAREWILVSNSGFNRNKLPLDSAVHVHCSTVQRVISVSLKTDIIIIYLITYLLIYSLTHSMVQIII